MPYLIDGNNLMFAVGDAVGEMIGRQGLCRLLAMLVEKGERVQVIFDGARPPAGQADAIAMTGVLVAYSGGHTADELILETIAVDSAPRRLHVVSSDHEIRTAAHARRCRSVTSADFARSLLHLQRALADQRHSRQIEPREKREGLSEPQTRRWLREFGFDD